MSTRVLRSSKRLKAQKEVASQTDDGKAEGLSCDCCLLPIGSDEEPKQGIARIETCSHRFHFGCIKKWSELETTCPQCKAVFTTIEKLCPKSGSILETVKCESLFLWDHPEEDDDHSSANEEGEHQEGAASGTERTPDPGLQLLSYHKVELMNPTTKRKKPVKVDKAAEDAERHLKRMAMNDVCYAPPTVPYASRPMPLTVKQNTEFKLKPVYEEDFIAK